MDDVNRRNAIKMAAVAGAATAVAAIPSTAEAATTLTSAGENSLLFDNCSAIQNSVLSGDTETLVMANAYMALPKPGAVDHDPAITFLGAIYLTPGANCKGVYVRFRRGYGVTGAIDYEIPNLLVVPGKPNVIPIAGIMNPTVYVPGPGQYTITVQQNGATSPGKVTYGSIAWFYTQFNH
jgi:hypothetical protein